MAPTHNLTDFEWVAIQELRSVNGVTIKELLHRVQYHGLQATTESISEALSKFAKMGLVRSLSIDSDPLWIRTPEGDLAANWYNHVELSESDPGPEPRPGETGQNRASAGPCDHYRHILGAPGPGDCWCGWRRDDHTAEALRHYFSQKPEPEAICIHQREEAPLSAWEANGPACPACGQRKLVCTMCGVMAKGCECGERF